MELRVLSGPQAGCRLPLGAGLYRAGADDCCDVVLEGLPDGQIAFIIYVGRRALALEPLIEGLRIDGRPARGLCELAAGAIFELQSWLFAVDDPDAPWPQDVQSLRRRESADRPDDPQADEAASGEGTELAPSGPEADSARAADTPDGAPDGAARAEGAEASRVQPQAAPQRPERQRVKLPFWLLGLLGTAAFLGLGVLVLAATLAPKKAAPAPDRAQLESALRRIASSVGEDVTVERLPTGRFKLSGHVANRTQRMSLTREARAADPAALIHVSADDDLEALAREALALFPGSGAEFGGVQRGRLTLRGHVSEGRLRDRIVAAMREEVPGLVAVDDQITAADDGLSALHELLTGAGLAERITGELDRGGGTRLIVGGSPDEAERLKWAGVRGQLASRFGESLQIVERFTVRDLFSPPSALPLPHPRTASSRDDVVAIVMGPMPYVLLRDGTKQAGRLATGAK